MEILPALSERRRSPESWQHRQRLPGSEGPSTLELLIQLGSPICTHGAPWRHKPPQNGGEKQSRGDGEVMAYCSVSAPCPFIHRPSKLTTTSPFPAAIPPSCQKHHHGAEGAPAPLLNLQGTRLRHGSSSKTRAIPPLIPLDAASQPKPKPAPLSRADEKPYF